MSLKFTFNKATEDDLPSLIKLENYAFQGKAFDNCRFDARTFKKYIKNPACEVIVVKDEGNTLAGYVIVAPSKSGDYSVIDSIAVNKNYLGQGLGSSLLKKAEEISLKKSFNTIILSVHENNTPAIRLYEKRGFEQVDEAKNVFGDGKSALIYKKKI